MQRELGKVILPRLVDSGDCQTQAEEKTSRFSRQLKEDFKALFEHARNLFRSEI